MFYTVVCTDNNDYVNWQCELLEYSWSRINQPGELVRLVACDTDEKLPIHRHARVIHTRPGNVHPVSGDVYVCYNRLRSLREWLDRFDIDGTILIVDCDVIFRKPILGEVSAGHPVAQQWLDYAMNDAFGEALEAASDVDVDTLQDATWPALIHSRDLRRLLPRWIEITERIREQTRRQESDMFAFLAASREVEISYELSKITAFMPWPDDRVGDAPLVHYCQVVERHDGSRLWGKGEYQPWEYVPNGRQAKLEYCRELIAMINQLAILRDAAQSHREDTIFIALASYCDPELVDTIESCLCKARRPENLRFGICHQYDNADSAINNSCLDRYSQDLRVRYVQYDYRDSRGGCWARNIAQQLYNGETYTLQIDAHTRMIESWDTILIDMLASLPSDKPLITAFPPLYYFESGTAIFQHVDDFSQVNTAIADEWTEEGWIPHPQKLIPENNTYPRRTRFLSGAFVFTLGQWNREVMQDPQHFYTGEEFALAVRSFTHGYDLFDPSQIVAWHRLHPQENRKFWNDNEDSTIKRHHDAAIHRLRLLLDGDPDNELGKFGPGEECTLEDFRVFSGLDWNAGSVHPDAIQGKPPDPVTIQPGKDQSTPEISANSMNSIVDVTIHLRHMAPLFLACDDENPVLITLFSSLQNRAAKPDDVIYLDLGQEGQERFMFRASELVSVETQPPLDQDFFEKLATIYPPAAGDRQASASNGIGRLPDDWKIWTWYNISRGSPKDAIFRELVQHGFPREVVKRELNHEPQLPLDQIQVLETAGHSTGVYTQNALARKIGSDKLEIFTVDNFLNEQECDALIELISAQLVPSVTANEELTPQVRTSHTCFFEMDNPGHALARETATRLSKLLGISSSYAEPLQGHVYEAGQEYKSHHDWFPPGTPEFDKHANYDRGGQRTWTALVYLNDVDEGGHTGFPGAELTVRPKRGRVVFWNNLCADGTPNQNALHHAKPLVGGRKAILTQWFRIFGDGPEIIRQPVESIPCFTEQGFERATIPEDLFTALSRFYTEEAGRSAEDELVEGEYLQNRSETVPSRLIRLSDALYERVGREILPICGGWCQRELALSAIYGIREYARNTTLRMHTDTRKTHIISAILNIDQSVEEDWPLEIEDHRFRRHSVLLKPGDMLLYEGARLPHGRLSPLAGKRYANLFVHYRPLDYNPTGS